MQLGPKFITVDEFDNYWTMNLREMLRTSANESNQAEMFLARVERRLMAYIDNNTFRRYKYEELYGAQLDAFKEAIILQAMYVYKNGDLGMESGYDAERGFVAKRGELVEISLCQDAIDVLSNAGLWNMVMKNRPRKFGGVLFGDYYSGGTGWPAPEPTPTPTPTPTPPIPEPTGFTITLLGINGTWDKSIISGIENNTLCSFVPETGMLVVGNQVATFTPNNNYVFASINYSEIIVSDTTVIARATQVPFPSTKYTITLNSTNGSWNKQYLSDLDSGTEYSFDVSTLTLTAGDKTAIFTPNIGTVYSTISSSSGIVNQDITITAEATLVTNNTITLASSNGSWNKTYITGITTGTTYSFDSDTLTLTVGSGANIKTAVFEPTYNDEFDNYLYDSISSSSGTVNQDITITATAIFNPDIEIYNETIYIDRGIDIEQHDATSATIDFTKTPDKVKLYFNILGFSDPTTSPDVELNELSYEINKNVYEDENTSNWTSLYYDGEWTYGSILVEFYLSSNELTINAVSGSAGNDGETVLQIYEIRAI